MSEGPDTGGAPMSDGAAISAAEEGALKTIDAAVGADKATTPPEQTPETPPAETPPADDFRYTYSDGRESYDLTKDEVDYFIAYAQHASQVLKEMEGKQGGGQETKPPEAPPEDQTQESALEARLKKIEEYMEGTQKRADDAEKEKQAKEIREEFNTLIKGNELLGKYANDPTALRYINTLALCEQSANPRAKFSDTVTAIQNFFGKMLAADKADYASGKLKAEQSAPPKGTSAPPKESGTKFSPRDVWGGGDRADEFEEAVARTIDMSSKH